MVNSYQATATDDITTTSDTDVRATGMVLTPPKGTYLVWFSGSATVQNAPNIFLSIYSNNTQVASSEQPLVKDAPFACVAKVTVNGTQTIEGRWRTGDGIMETMSKRNLTIMEVATDID